MKRGAVFVLGILLTVVTTASALSPLETLTNQVKQCRRDLRVKQRASDCDPTVLAARLFQLSEGSDASSNKVTRRELGAAARQIQLLVDGVPMLDDVIMGAGSATLDEAAGVPVSMQSADKFDRGNELKSPSALRGLVTDLTECLYLDTPEKRQKIIAEFGVDILIMLKRPDPGGALAALFGRRFDDYLAKHRHRDRFYALRLAAIDGRLKFAYRLKDEALYGEDLGPVENWFTLTGGGGSAGSAASVEAAMKAPGAAASAATPDPDEKAAQAAGAGAMASKAAAALAKSLGAGEGGGGSGSLGAAGGGNAFGGPNPFVRLQPANGAAGVSAGLGAATMNDPGPASKPSAQAGGRLSAEGAQAAPSTSKSTKVPMPNSFAKREDNKSAPNAKNAAPVAKAPAAAAPPGPAAAAPPKTEQPIGPLKSPAAASASLTPGAQAAAVTPEVPQPAPQASPRQSSPPPAAPPQDFMRDAVAGSPAASPTAASPYDPGPVAEETEPNGKSRSPAFPIILAVAGLGLESWRRKILKAERRAPWSFN